MKTKTLLLASTLVIGTAVAAFGHGNATGIVKERMHGMMAMGKALGAIADMFKGKAEFNPEQIGAAAAEVGTHAQAIERLFPDTKQSKTGTGTEALPSIWEKNAEFVALAKQLGERAASLQEIASTGDERKIRVSFAQVSKVCAACHTDYRKPKE